MVDGGRLRFRSVGIPEPVEAEKADLTLHFAPEPHPLTWRLELANRTATPRPESLTITGSYERWLERPEGHPDLDLTVKGNAWPWTAEQSGLSARGLFQGEMKVDRHAHHWTLAGEVGLKSLDVTGPRFGGDHFRLDQVQGAWRLVETEGGWDIPRFEVTSPVGTLHASGNAQGSRRVEGTLDLAALARQLPHALYLRDDLTLEKGTAKLTIAARNEADGQVWELAAQLSDIQLRNQQHAITLRSPAELSARVSRARTTCWPSSRRWLWKSMLGEFLNIEGRGDSSIKGVSLTGYLRPQGTPASTRRPGRVWPA